MRLISFFLFIFFSFFSLIPQESANKEFHHYFMVYFDSNNQFLHYDYKINPFLFVGIRYGSQTVVKNHLSFDFLIKDQVYIEEARSQFTPSIGVTLFYFPFITYPKWYKKFYTGILFIKSETEKQERFLFPFNESSSITGVFPGISLKNQYFISIIDRQKNLYGMGLQIGYRWEWNLSTKWGFFIDALTGIISYFPYRTDFKTNILPVKETSTSLVEDLYNLTLYTNFKLSPRIDYYNIFSDSRRRIKPNDYLLGILFGFAY
jgi:hypothetical protein